MAEGATERPLTRKNVEAAPVPTPSGRPSGKVKFVAGSRLLGRLHVPAEGKGWLAAAAMLWGLGMFKGFNLITLLATFMMVLWALNAFWAGRQLAA